MDAVKSSQSPIPWVDAADLQEDIEVANGAITGTLKHVTDYTGFSSDTDEQSGNFLALKLEAFSGATIQVELVNGTVGKPVTLDSDGMIVLRITDISTQSIKVIATIDSVSETISYSISGLTLNEE